MIKTNLDWDKHPNALGAIYTLTTRIGKYSVYKDIRGDLWRSLFLPKVPGRMVGFDPDFKPRARKTMTAMKIVCEKDYLKKKMLEKHGAHGRT